MCVLNTIVIGSDKPHLISGVLKDVRAFHSLYFKADCKLHTFCIRLNIISGTLAKGKGIACIGRKSMQLAV